METYTVKKQGSGKRKREVFDVSPLQALTDEVDNLWRQMAALTVHFEMRCQGRTRRLGWTEVEIIF